MAKLVLIASIASSGKRPSSQDIHTMPHMHTPVLSCCGLGDKGASRTSSSRLLRSSKTPYQEQDVDRAALLGAHATCWAVSRLCKHTSVVSRVQLIK